MTTYLEAADIKEILPIKVAHAPPGRVQRHGTASCDWEHSDKVGSKSSHSGKQAVMPGIGHGSSACTTASVVSAGTRTGALPHGKRKPLKALKPHIPSAVKSIADASGWEVIEMGVDIGAGETVVGPEMVSDV